MNLRGAGPLLPVAGAFALGAAAARILAAARPADEFARDFAQPLVVVTAWGAYGRDCFAVLALTLGLASLATLAALRKSDGPTPGTSAIALAATAALVAAYAWPFVFSSDAYAYAAYGWLAAHGGDPYASVPPGVRGTFVDAARFQWQGPFPPCVYGPAFVAIAQAVVVATGGTQVAAAVAALRLLAGAAFIGCIFALSAALDGLPERRRGALLVAFALNPVVIWSVAEGHNDSLVLLVACTGFALVRRRAVAPGSFIVGLSLAFKATGAAFAAGLALEALAFAPRSAWRRIVVPLAAGAFAAAVLAVPPILPVLGAARSGGRYLPTTSAQALVGLAPVLVVVPAAAFYGLRRLQRRERDGFAWLGIATWLGLPNPYPWYALWLVPATLAAGQGYVSAALYGVTILSFLRYLPDATGTIGPSELRLAAGLAAFPLLLAFGRFVRPFPFRKTSQT